MYLLRVSLKSVHSTRMCLTDVLNSEWTLTSRAVRLVCTCCSTTYYRYRGTGRMMRDCCSTTYYRYTGTGRMMRDWALRTKRMQRHESANGSEHFYKRMTAGTLHWCCGLKTVLLSLRWRRSCQECCRWMWKYRSVTSTSDWQIDVRAVQRNVVDLRRSSAGWPSTITCSLLVIRVTLCVSAVFAVEIWLSVCLSHAGIVFKRLNLSWNFFNHLIAPLFYFFDPLRRYPIPREPHQRERKIHGEWENWQFSTEIAIYLGNGTR